MRVHTDGRGAGKERGQIDEVAHLADDTAAAYRGIVDPRLGRNQSGIHAIIHDQRRAPACVEVCQLTRQGRKASVVTDQQQFSPHVFVLPRSHPARQA